VIKHRFSVIASEAMELYKLQILLLVQQLNTNSSTDQNSSIIRQ